MNTQRLKTAALLVLTLLATMAATAQTVNMSRYITLTVTQGQQIRLDLMAAAAGTKVKVVSGSTEQTITVGTSWTGFQNFTAGSTTMTVYGDITGFNCDFNGTKLTALNVSHNTALTELWCQNNQITSLDVTQNTALTELGCWSNRLTALDVSQNTALTWFDCSGNQLTSLDVSQNTALKELYCEINQLTSLDVSQNTAMKKLWCYGNSFTTQAFNDIMCSLPARTAADNAKFYPLYNASDAGASAFMAANAQIAKNKGWQVRYWEGNEDEIPPTTGTYTCPVVNMSRYITLTVTQGQQIRLDLQAAAAGTGVKIVSGSTNQTITVGTSWTGYRNYTAGSTTMTVYGDIIGFDCQGNGTKLTALDVSHNTALKELYCQDNQITALDVSQNTALEGLYCRNNLLTSLNVSQNTALTGLNCSSNQLTALDISHNTALTNLWCSGNQLTALDVSQNTALTELKCDGNSFTTQAFNDLMCSLPARVAADDARFHPLNNASDANHATFMATNAQIAIAKNWQVRYYNDSGAMPATTGTYTCPVVNMSRYITLTVQQGQQIRLDLQAAAAGTPVKIVSGSTEQTITVGTDWTDFQNYTAGATTMTVYGDITGFDCSNNGTKLTALDVSHNTALTGLYCWGNQLTSLNVSQNTALIELICYNNRLTSLDVSHNTALTGLACGSNQLTALDVSHNTALTGLDCSDNQLTSLDVSRNTALKELYCRSNQLTSLDVSQNTAMTWFDCSGNQLTSLDVSQNTALKELYCRSNQLTSLDVSQNTAMKKLWCYGNNFTTQAFNDLMCSLPARTTADNAKFYPLYNASDAGASAFMAANAQIAKNKGWQVRYWEGNEDEIPATTGTYVCGTGIAEIASVPLSVYPNPATDILTVETEATGSVITLTDLTGRTVLTATATAGKTVLNLSELSAGTYIVRVGDRVGKVVKR